MSARVKKVALISLGCFRNSYDSESVLREFIGQGYRFTQNSLECDVLIVNTCGFITAAKEESIDAIRRAQALRKSGRARQLIVMGCLAQRYGKELKREFPGVDLWRGVKDIRGVQAAANKILPAHLGFLKICEGCVNRCSYCAIPLIKGPLKSRPASELLEEAAFLNASGIRELNIIGQDITSWGKDLSGKNNLEILLKKILAVTKKIPWVRLIYAHPKHFTPGLIGLMAAEKRICRYIDLPVQHAGDRILKAMNRGVTKRTMLSLIGNIRKNIPGVAIRTSVIVGFPGETEKDFRELTAFLKEVRFDRLGAFIYSREEGTPAYNYRPQVHYATKQRRLKEVMLLQEEIAYRANQRFLGRTLDVLAEEKDKDYAYGRTQYDAYEVDGSVFLPKSVKTGEFCRARITDVLGHDLKGEL